MKAAENVTEELKTQNQLEWVQKMNNIRNLAEEIIKSEMIYSQICDKIISDDNRDLMEEEQMKLKRLKKF